jgi:hypothetical protein
MVNYRPTGRSRLGRPSKRLLDETETDLSRPNSWRMMVMMMMMMMMMTTLLVSRLVSAWNGLIRETFFFSYYCVGRGSVAARLLGLRILIPPGAWVPLSWSVVCCQLEVSASGWSLDKRSPINCDVSEGVRETSIMRRPWPSRGCYAITFRCWPNHRSYHGMSRRMQALYAIKLPSCGER